ncbi:uncharacterized protein TNIN_409091 [Trichonephila inaurata madagascariensis]|uniref:Uncharacterized protein n=1 Tax=Trichonephila inaurata madagascariensis TaxID=2747483 RepID=A0A8X6WLC8_9ARAC|nr:uncharacterized protein TNIN_409091 [Trichonephila inaurata madagascariensis]
MKIKDKEVWTAAPDHPGISRKSPGGVLEFDGDGNNQMVVSRLLSEHLKCMTFESGRKFFESNTNTSTRDIAQQLGVCESLVWPIVHQQGVPPYHLQGLQLLQRNEYPKHVKFAQWFAQKCVLDASFPGPIIFTVEASFTHEGMFNPNKSHVWAYDNPYSTRNQVAEHDFAVNVWAGIIGGCLLGPYLLPPRLDSQK